MKVPELFTFIAKLFRTRPALAAFLCSLLIACIAAAPATRDYYLSTLVIEPAAAENGTNIFRVTDKTGTNWVAVSPTNASLQVTWQGTNYTAITHTNFFLTNGGVAYPVKIRNGLWVQ